MSEQSSGDKTEAATPKKRADAAKEGDLLRSRDLTGAAMFIALFGWMAAIGGKAIQDGTVMLHDGLSFDRRAIIEFAPGKASTGLLMHFGGSLGLLVLVTIVAICLASAALGSLGVRWASLKPKWSRVDPMAGLKRIFGAEALTGLAVSLLKVAAVVGVTGWLLSGIWRDLMQLARLGPWSAAARTGSMMLDVMGWLAAIMVAAALIDVVVQWRRREKRLMMTKQDIRDEHKQAEGAPEQKRMQRERAYAIANRSARKAMTEATVVLTNPTHFAIALRYRPEIDAVPVVVARGADDAARAIRDLARENNVPQLDYPLLARAIYFTTQVGQPVRDELYLAVATVLAFVFNLEAALAAGRTAPAVDVPEALRFGPDGRVQA